MAEDAENDQKTEEPSERKLSRARAEGQVPVSREVNTWVMLVALSGMMLVLAGPAARALTAALAGFVDVDRFVDAGGIRWEALRASLAQILWVLLVPLGIALVAALGGNIAQTGLVFTTEKLGFDIGHLSPLKGFGRLFSLRALVEFLKNLAKVVIVGAVATSLLAPELGRLTLLTSFGAAGIADETWRLSLRLAFGVLVVVTALALVDYVYQRFALRRSLRMTKQELKEELRDSEGDPVVKMRLRQIRMERARKRMMAAVPTASVVVTNPTHFAVALKYEMGSQGAPRVVAKGADLIALRIREVAKANDVPVVENPPLARTLYASVEIDEEIPPEHYKAVAEVIGFVFRLKGKTRRP